MLAEKDHEEDGVGRARINRTVEQEEYNLRSSGDRVRRRRMTERVMRGDEASDLTESRLL